MFKWMDTTLGAGALAIIAAAVVILNGAIERAARLREETGRSKEAIRDAVASVRSSFRMASMTLLAASQLEHVTQTMDRVDAAVMSLAHRVPVLANKLAHVSGFARLQMAGATSSRIDAPDRRVYKVGAASICDATFFYLHDIEAVLKDPEGHRQVVNSDTKSRLNWDVIEPSAQNLISDLLTFTD